PARKTRAWLPLQHPRLRYVYVPPSRVNALVPAADLAAKEKEWLDQFVTLRRKQAERLFEVAREALTADHISLAVELANEALRENPDHQELRRILGYVEYEDQGSGKTWRTPYEVAQLRKGLILHDRFGWLQTDHTARYEAGERLLGGKWVTAA